MPYPLENKSRSYTIYPGTTRLREKGMFAFPSMLIAEADPVTGKLNPKLQYLIYHGTATPTDIKKFRQEVTTRLEVIFKNGI